jgi:Holliday junction resolvase RusA-like endonuclease
MRLNIKPLSVNEAWRGRKFKTPKYKEYERKLLLLLPNKFKEDFTKLNIEIGVNTLFDIDNCLKPLIDILQKKYKFNDRYITELNIKKVVVKKGNEYIIIE